MAGDRGRGRARKGLHRPRRRRRAARAAPPARRRPHLPHGDRARRGALGSGQAARAADDVVRLHRARDGLPGNHQRPLRALHAPDARHHEVARLPRLQEDHPPERARLERAEPRPRRPPDEPRDRRRVRVDDLDEPAHGGQGLPALVARERLSGRLRPRLRARDVALPLSRRGQRARGQDRQRDDLVQRGGEPVQLGRLLRHRAGNRHLVDGELQRDGRPRRARAGLGGEGRARVQRGRDTARPVRDLVQGTSQGRATRPAPQAGDDPHAVGAALATTQDDEEAT